MLEESKKYSIMLPADIAFSSSVRKTTESILRYLEADDRDVYRLVLVMDELFMNAVQHGSSTDPNVDSSVHISFYFEKGINLRVEIEDEGTGKGHCAQTVKEKVSLEFQRQDPKKHSGRGLAQLALSFTSNFIIEDSQYGGVKISFSKDLNNSDED